MPLRNGVNTGNALAKHSLEVGPDVFLPIHGEVA
jgi:hypothetical protein